MRFLFTYLFLLVFLLPQAEMNLHALEHEGEEHCLEYELTHLHEKHHDCKVCDYSFENGDGLNFYSFIRFDTSHFQSTKQKSNSVLTTTLFYSLLRGPPAIS